MVAYPYTILNTSKFIQRMTGMTAPVIKRPMHILADGSVVFMLFDENDGGNSWGSHDNVAKISLWQSNVARTTWTKKVTYTLPAGTFPTAGSFLHGGSALMNDESVYIIWRDVQGSTAPGYSLHGAMFARSGSTWTAPTAREDLYQPADAFPFRFDLDVNRTTGDLYIGWMFNATDLTANTMGVNIMVRKSSTVRTLLSGGVAGIGSTGNVHPLNYSEEFTMAVDSASDATYTRLAFLVSASTSTRDYGDYVGYRVVRNSDSAMLNGGWIRQNLNQGRGEGRRTSFMFCTANGEFAIIGMGGVASGEGYAMKYKTSSPVATYPPVFTSPVPIQYTASKYAMSRQNGLWADVAVSYANGKFAIHYYDTGPGYFRDIVGKFNANSVTWENPAYTWDSFAASGVTIADDWRRTSAGAVYGGSRRADTSNAHNAMLVYFSLTSIASPTAWAYQTNWPWVAPASVLPSGNVNSSTPVLGAYAQIYAPLARSAEFIRWQIASDIGFTTALKDYTSLTGVKVDNTHNLSTKVYISEKLPQALAAPTGTWYIRAAQVDSFGTQGAWSSPQTFVVTHPPTGSDLTPSGASIFEYAAGNVTFGWTFEDPYEFDSQSAYRVLVEQNDDVSTVVLDTGKVTSSDDFATLAIPLLAKNIQLKWRVQLWDMDDAVGPLSSYALFTAADAPTVTITSPADASVVDNARPVVQWITADPVGTGQAAFRVYFLNEGLVVHDSGWRNGADQAYTPSDIILQNLKSYSMVVSARDGAGLETQSTISFTTSWALPANPDLTSLFIDTDSYGSIGGGYVRIIWQNVTADPEFLSWRLYRRYHLKTSVAADDKGLNWEILHEEFSVSPPPDTEQYEFLDYTAPSGYDVHYILTQTAVRFGSIVESAHPTLADEGRLVSLYSGHYWLINPAASGFPEDVLRLEGATADTYTDEYETEEMHLIGRGRHVEIGDRLGYSGQLTLRLRYIEGSAAPDDPRRQKLDLEAFRAARTECVIRSPFGDLFTASTLDMQFERIAGVGQTEFTNVTLPYREVYRADESSF